MVGDYYRHIPFFVTIGTLFYVTTRIHYSPRPLSLDGRRRNACGYFIFPWVSFGALWVDVMPLLLWLYSPYLKHVLAVFPSDSHTFVMSNKHVQWTLNFIKWSDPTWSDPTWSDSAWSDPTWSDTTWSDPTWSDPAWSDPAWSDPAWSDPTWSDPP